MESIEKSTRRKRSHLGQFITSIAIPQYIQPEGQPFTREKRAEKKKQKLPQFSYQELGQKGQKVIRFKTPPLHDK